jgi:hypothetical protein
MASSTAAGTIFQTGSRARSEVFIPDEEDRIRINASDVYHLDLHIVRGDRRPSRARGALDDARALRPRGPRMTQTPLPRSRRHQTSSAEDDDGFEARNQTKTWHAGRDSRLGEAGDSFAMRRSQPATLRFEAWRRGRGNQ